MDPEQKSFKLKKVLFHIDFIFIAHGKNDFYPQCMRDIQCFLCSQYHIELAGINYFMQQYIYGYGIFIHLFTSREGLSYKTALRQDFQGLNSVILEIYISWDNLSYLALTTSESKHYSTKIWVICCNNVLITKSRPPPHKQLKPYSFLWKNPQLTVTERLPFLCVLIIRTV